MLKSFKKAFLLAVSTSAIVMALVFVVAKAGSLTPSGPVGSTMKSLQELYDALAGTFNSASQSANVNGNIIQQLKYISNNLSWTQSGNNIYNSNSGNVGIGQAVPSAALHLKAGTAAAGTAPLKLAAGINLAALEAGAIEFDGTSLYFTPSTTRKTIAFDDSIHSAVTLAGENYLSLSTQQITANAINLAGTNVTGILPLANGGTNANLTAVNGGIVYSGASALAISAAGVSGQALISGGAGTPAWFTPTAGSILFAGASGILAQDNSNFFWDDANNRLGIGTAAPTSLLNLKGTLASALTGTVSVTIGTAAVTGVGTLFTTELTTGDSIKIGSEIFTVSAIASNTSLTLDSNHSAGASGATAYRDANLFAIDNGDAVNKLTITRSGYVGIGTATPSAALHIGAGSPTGLTTYGDSVFISGELEVGETAYLGPMEFGANSGAISWIDMPVRSCLKSQFWGIIIV